MRTPNFFIVGAPKCGTTALSEYLRKHPQIFFSYPKEPHYFAEDLGAFRFMDTRGEYIELFERATDKHLAVGDGSSHYMYSSVAIQKIYDYNATAKLIVMLRNPVELVHSYHSELLYVGYESEPDFSKSWALQSHRRNGQCIPKKCPSVKVLLYKEMGMLGEQLERLLAVFPRDQVKIILFDDFAADPKGTYENVLSFLGVPPDGRTHFPRINPNKERRSKILGDFLTKQPRIWIRSSRLIRKVTGLQRIGLSDTLRRVNTMGKKRPPLSLELREKLRKEFAADIAKLSGILNRDLSQWS